jgi:hypothetical protein
MSKYINVEIDVDLDEWTDKELVEEMKLRGFFCSKTSSSGIDKYDLNKLLEIIDSQSLVNWEIASLREKILHLRDHNEQP